MLTILHVTLFCAHNKIQGNQARAQEEVNRELMQAKMVNDENQQVTVAHGKKLVEDKQHNADVVSKLQLLK